MGLYSRYIFPRVLDLAMSAENFEELRRELLADAAGNTLEIGFGTGLNLPYYPSAVTRLATVDPNPGMDRLAARRVRQSSIPVEHHRIRGESLPFNAATFDTVVSTWTLCSIPGVRQALSEIRRVMKPDGRFLFLEHGLADAPGVRKWQHRLTPVQQVVGDGCHLDRDIEGLVRASGFRILHLEKFYMRKVPRIGGYIFRGAAARGNGADQS